MMEVSQKEICKNCFCQFVQVITEISNQVCIMKTVLKAMNWFLWPNWKKCITSSGQTCKTEPNTPHCGQRYLVELCQRVYELLLWIRSKGPDSLHVKWDTTHRGKSYKRTVMVCSGLQTIDLCGNSYRGIQGAHPIVTKQLWELSYTGEVSHFHILLLAKIGRKALKWRKGPPRWGKFLSPLSSPFWVKHTLNYKRMIKPLHRFV